jgi:formate hydrogenlyase subunit 6/NADH:ubiquinone oxidoreductase subunit I
MCKTRTNKVPSAVTACGLCVLWRGPAEAITMEAAERKKKAKKTLYREEKNMQQFMKSICFVCIFCGLCEEACPERSDFSLPIELFQRILKRNEFIYGKR